ncbi:MAG: protein translocase subunit SecF, partial [Opitutales bacterium]|nr:protein translocase subunit SecF [Opitutales bacterium]
YERAFVTIFDSQLTSLVTAGILIWMGTGSVKGFGVTLAIGIVTTLFTCLVTCRGLQELLVNLGISHRFFGIQLMKKTPKFRFMEHWRGAVGFSAILVLVSIAFPLIKGDECLSKDFKGGESVTLSIVQDTTKHVGIGEIKEIINSIGIEDATAIYQQKVGASEQTLSIECELTEDTSGGEFSNIEKIVGKLLEVHPEMFPAGTETTDEIIVGKQAVGAVVSGQLVKMAIISLFLAVLGIMVYVALRFEFGFGVGAMLSTIHDIVVVTGLYLICGGQFSASMIAAILMVAGYSINDTIVVFDRIREELGNNPGMKLRDIINLSINRTLSRTLLTSVTVFLAAVSLAVFGAGDVAEYGKVFIFGVLVGTFSSIYVASPIFYWWHKGDRKKVEEGDKAYTYSWEAGNEKK